MQFVSGLATATAMARFTFVATRRVLVLVKDIKATINGPRFFSAENRRRKDVSNSFLNYAEATYEE